MTAHVLVQKACAKLRSAIGDQAVMRLNFTDDLREMLHDLEVIQPVADQMLMDEHKARLVLLNRVVYRIMDMVGELQDTRPPMTRMVHRLAIKKNVMATNVQDMKSQVKNLKEYFDYETHSDFREEQQRLIDGRLTEPFFEEALVFGRGADKQRIVAVLQSAASNITQGPPSCIILPIFGLPGSGKTTLAQMVFNDDTHYSLQEYNFRVWVHVSPELGFHRICESILRQVMPGGGDKEEIDDHGSNSDVVGMEHILKRLQDLLNGKKVLLVLDDLWEDNSIQLHLLKSMLTFLGDKVDVIVTTCNQAIARKVCTVAQPYRLNPLGDDTCWEIIKKSIRFEEEDEELEKIGRKIASKCMGVPQAALIYASKLARSRDPTKWEEFMEIINAWSTYYESPIIETLDLSYRSMPPELMLCFDYCYIFLNGHNIVKDDLVHQWIALDFIEPSGRSSATEVAEGYITRLLDMSFFQTAKSNPASGNDDKGVAIFTMHDLVYSFIWPMPGFNEYMQEINLTGKLDDKGEYLRALRCVGCTKVEFNDDSFPYKRSLRVLELKESSVPKLPDSIWQLRHLGYLKISEFSELVALPDSFGDLNNLFHIDLSGCSRLVTLPESFGKLIRLVHVNLSGCSGLVTLPESFGNLVNLSHIDLSRCHRLSEILEVLKKFVELVFLDLSFWSLFEGIEECLGQLTKLEHLNLSNPCCYIAQQRSHLQEIKNVMRKLTRLRYLNLSMCLNPIFYYKSEEESLQYIESCVSGLSSLEHLDLSHNTFLFDLPESLGRLNKLHTLDLSGCIRLKKVDAMKSLKFIALKNCRALESCNFVVCGDEDGAYRSSSNIVQLEDVNCQELQISGLEKVRSKEEAQRIKLVGKQKLQKLTLSWNLDSIREVEESALLGELVPPPNLQCLEINGYDGTCLPEYLGNLISLRELKIICCKQLNLLPDSIQELTNLNKLCISDCPELNKWCQLEKNRKRLAHIPKKNYEEHGSTSRPEIEEDCTSIEEDCTSIDEVEAV